MFLFESTIHLRDLFSHLKFQVDYEFTPTRELFRRIKEPQIDYIKFSYNLFSRTTGIIQFFE